jgi:hypothetical protein
LRTSNEASDAIVVCRSDGRHLRHRLRPKGGDVTTTNVTSWTGRDIEELIQVAGPYDVSSLRGDLRTYTWKRGVCRMDARTSLDNKITTVEMMGTSQACSPYLTKLGAG